MNAGRLAARAFGVAVFLACSIPAALLLYDAFRGDLGANPIEEITERTGKTGLILLMITLAVTPAVRFLGWSRLIRLRRMLGLFAFTYVTLHFLTYLVLDQFFSWETIVEDVAKRPYITLGFTSFVLLIPLALTSTKKMIKRLGGKRWNRLHSLIYFAAGGGAVHFLWQVKADTRDPDIFGGIIVLLLATRLIPKRRPAARPRPVSTADGAGESRDPERLVSSRAG